MTIGITMLPRLRGVVSARLLFPAALAAVVLAAGCAPAIDGTRRLTTSVGAAPAAMSTFESDLATPKVGVSGLQVQVPTPVEPSEAEAIRTGALPAGQVQPGPADSATPPQSTAAQAEPVRHARVPILMYHYVGPLPADADKYRRDLTVTQDRFEEHLRYLKSAGFQSISLHDLYLNLTAGQPLPEKPVVLTFDDGYLDNYQVAFPLLKQYGFKGAFFIVTDFVDNGRPEYATWEQLREMHAAGMEIEAHSRDHPDLRHRSVDFLVWQILGPAEAIAAHVGERPAFFAYPSGKYDEQVIEVVKSAHYLGAASLTQGTDQSTDRLFELQRIRVRGTFTDEDVAREIE